MGAASAQVQYVTVTISGPKLAARIVQRLAKIDDSHYFGMVNNIPAGTGFTFVVEAFGSGSPPPALYRGTATNVSIVAGRTAQVAITLQQVDPPPVMTVPVIDALSASAISVEGGSTVSLAVSASSPDGHALRYEWHASCGALAHEDSQLTTWAAPWPFEGTCELSVTVSDPVNDMSIKGFLSISVRPAKSNVEIQALINTYPVVTLTVDAYWVPDDPAPPGLSVGITADLVAAASDPDGDVLGYAWTAECDRGATGTFTPSATTAAPRFTCPDPSAQCTLSIAVSDGRGGTTVAQAVLGSTTTGDGGP